MAQQARVGDAARFVQRVYVWADGEPDESLSCTICYEALTDAVSLPCGHHFCSACVDLSLQTARRCPMCRAEVAVIAVPEPALDVRERVNCLRVHCSGGIALADNEWVADAAGCPEVLTVATQAAHEATCGWARVACAYAGCGQAVRRRDMEAHEAAAALAHAAGERAARLAREREDARAAAAAARAPQYELPAGFAQLILFELFGESPEEATPEALAWRSYRGAAFCGAWAQQCTADGLHVVPLQRAEGGVCTQDETKQIRFERATPITGMRFDIQTRSRGTRDGDAPVWTLAELVILKNAFVKAMESSMGSLDSAGAHIDHRPSVRGRLFLQYNA